MTKTFLEKKKEKLQLSRNYTFSPSKLKLISKPLRDGQGALGKSVNSSSLTANLISEATKQYVGIFFQLQVTLIIRLINLFIASEGVTDHLKACFTLGIMVKTISMSNTKRIFFCILGISSTFFSATLFLALLSMFRPPFNAVNVATGTNESERYDDAPFLKNAYY